MHADAAAESASGGCKTRETALARSAVALLRRCAETEGEMKTRAVSPSALARALQGGDGGWSSGWVDFVF